MKKHQFVSANGIDVEISITGSYRDCPDKDIWVIASNGYDEEFYECGDEDMIIEALEENGIELDEFPRHFLKMVILDCMILGELTLDQALDYQARWEAEQR